MRSVAIHPGAIGRMCAKVAVLPFGIPGLRRRGDLLILAYHRVGSGKGEIELSPHVFERHLAFLAEHEGRRLRSLDDALSEGGGTVVTFDDGYRDFADVVVPLLVRYRIPALLYLATGLIANGGSTTASPDTALTWPMLEEAVATGLVSVGSHTHGHTSLARSEEEEASSEMRRSKDLIEDHLQVVCRHFSYPWGVGSAGADRAARRIFDTAALDGWRTNRRGDMDVHRLGRTPVLRSDGMMFFRAKTLGLLDSEAMLYRAFGRGPWGKM